MNDDFDEEIARLWAQALQGETPEVARARRARETDQHLERAYYRDPARFIPGAVDKQRRTTKKKPRKDTPKWHS